MRVTGIEECGSSKQTVPPGLVTRTISRSVDSGCSTQSITPVASEQSNEASENERSCEGARWSRKEDGRSPRVGIRPFVPAVKIPESYFLFHANVASGSAAVMKT
jgi:hypothetical protein